jgi:hypothetical protein
MHYMHYKDYIHHGLAAEKTPPPLPQGGNHLAGGGGVGVPAHIYTYIYHTRSIWVRGSPMNCSHRCSDDPTTGMDSFHGRMTWMRVPP